MDKLDHSYIVDSHVEWGRHSGKEFGMLFKNLTSSTQRMQQLYPKTFISELNCTDENLREVLC